MFPPIFLMFNYLLLIDKISNFEPHFELKLVWANNEKFTSLILMNKYIIKHFQLNSYALIIPFKISNNFYSNYCK